MATGSSMPPMLRLKRSSQSLTYAMSLAAWVTVYSESCSLAFVFAGCSIDLSNMQAGDTILVRITKQLVSGGGYILHDQVSYSGAQPTAHPAITIPPIPSVYGVMIEMQQTVGVARSVNVESYDAKRLGLS